MMAAQTSSTLALLVALAVLSHARVTFGLGLASETKPKRAADDSFRKGYRTRLTDFVEQDDNYTSLSTYGRGAAAETAKHDVDIGAGPAGYMGNGGAQFRRSAEFDRGVKSLFRIRTDREAANRTSAGIDSGRVVDLRRSAAQIGNVPGAVSAGANAGLGQVTRHQDVANSESTDQYVLDEIVIEEQHDRGVINQAGASQATILNGGIATGASSTDSAWTRDRADTANNIIAAGIVARHVEKDNRVVNDVAASKASESAAVYAPFGAAGGERVHEDVRSNQLAAHEGLVLENRTVMPPVIAKRLQSDWGKKNAASQASIDAFAGVASGVTVNQLATGIDQANETSTFVNQDSRMTTMGSVEFDNRHGVRVADSNTVLD